MRRRFPIVLSIVAALFVFGMAGRVLKPAPLNAAIRIGSYEIWGERGALGVHVILTNSGHYYFQTDKSWVLELQTAKGATTNRELGGLVFPRTEVLPPGTSDFNYHHRVQIPAGTVRWRIGYLVQVASAREAFRDNRKTEKLPPIVVSSISKLLSNKPGLPIRVWSEIFEVPSVHVFPASTNVGVASSADFAALLPEVPE